MFQHDINFWDQKTIAWPDLPCLQDLFKACDLTMLKRVIVDDFACSQGAPTRKERRAMEKRLDASLDVMCSLTPDCKKFKPFVLVPKEFFVLKAGGVIQRQVAARMVPLLRNESKKKVRRALDRSGSTQKYASKATPQFCQETLLEESSLRVFSAEWASGQGFAFFNWAEVLGCRVWLGGQRSRWERYEVLASIFWEMTFCGFEYKKAHQRMRRMRSSCIMQSPLMSVGDQQGNADRKATLQGIKYGLRESCLPETNFMVRMAGVVETMNQSACFNFFELRLDMERRLEEER